MTTCGPVSPENVKVLIRDTLQLFVGQGRRFSYADLAAATGDCERKLRSYADADPNMMPLDVALRVFTVLPTEALARLARLMGVAVSPLDVDDAATVRASLAGAARLVADGTEAMADGRISHSERAQLGRQAAALLPSLQALANGETVQ